MWGETKQATSATTSLIYITVGALIDVWSVIYYFYLRNHGGTDIGFLCVAGFFFSGLVLFLIGLAVGRIGHAARPAEVAPSPTAQVITPNAVMAATIPAAGIAPVAPLPAQSVPVTPVPVSQVSPVVMPARSVAVGPANSAVYK